MRSLRSSYLTALIVSKGMNICVTFVDNSIHFFRASKLLHKKLRMIAIQNGNRFDLEMWSSDKQKEIFIPEYACFGKNDIDRLFSLKAYVGKHYLMGSLVAIAAKQRVSHLYRDKIEKYQYDLCIVAECFAGYDNKYPGIEDAVGKIANYAQRFSLENNLSAVIVFKYGRERLVGDSGLTESQFYQKYISLDAIEVSYRDDDYLSSYLVSSKSRVTVGMISTLLLETASMGNRVLICDFYGNPWSLNVDEPLSYTDYDCSYRIFEYNLMKVLAESEENYWDKRSAAVDYYVKINGPRTVQCALSSIINQ